MKKLFVLAVALLFSACSTKYILIDESGNPVEDGYYTSEDTYSETDINLGYSSEYANSVNEVSANDVFVVREGVDYVTYQYKNVRVDEIAPLASMYCADVTYGSSPYLREVSLYHNGFMRATFDCVNIAI